MRAGSLFSGVGGLDLGLHRAGIRHAFFCESDPWRRSVLAHHWPGVPIYHDVATVGSVTDVGEGRLDHGAVGAARHSERAVLPVGNEVAAVDLLSGGFPCQDVSVAGQRRGLAGARSGLFHEFARIIDAFRPGWVLIENVPGLLSSNGGRDFGVVLGTLADVGYGVAWRIVDSRFFGVPQRRRRVFIVGALATGDPRAASERAGQVLAVGTRCPRHSATRTKARPEDAVASLSGLGTGGADDNDGQAGRIVSLALNAKRGSRDDGESETFVTHALTSEGHDASEDGTGRGTPLVAAPLSHGSNPNSNMAGRRREDDENLVTQPDDREETFVTAFSHTQGLDAQPSARAWPSLRREGGGHGVGVGVGVRRLTPVECERLQAWPDGWTDPDGTAPDSRRYAACGDGVTATVSEWIGRRLLAAHTLGTTQAATTDLRTLEVPW